MTENTTDPADWQLHIVDDDAAFARSLVFLLESMNWPVQVHGSAADYLEHGLAHEDTTGCLLLDVRMPGMSGLELQQKLQARDYSAPIVFLTGHGDVQLAVQAMKRGAFDFLEKPFRDQHLIDVVSAALRQRQADSLQHRRAERAGEKLARLTPREAEVARLVAQGQPNKLVAHALEISERTVHVHRQKVMEKTEVSSAAELARLMWQADPEAFG